jgi:hypothetical protein
LTTVHDLLDQYARLARNTREKGLLLEKLAQARHRGGTAAARNGGGE